MQPARPLREVFDELARGDAPAGPAGALAESGHDDLPDQLVSEAIVNYADTAPIEVAEHLAPFVKVHSAVPAGDDAAAADLAASRGLDLLATAPEQLVSDDLADGVPDDGADEVVPEPAGDLSYADALDFGFGQGAGDQPGEAVAEPEQDYGVAFEPTPAVEVPPIETADELTPWIARPEPAPAEESGDEPEDDAAGG